MDWLKGMNAVVAHIEDNLTHPIPYQSLSQIVGCSVYEFSRIFSFMAGMSISEYIRRRRLSQAAFDIQAGRDKIIDIALKYCYESPTTFSRAFKELHGTTPLSARQAGTPLKTYPPISFQLTIKGANEMEFRIEEKPSFEVMGLSGYIEGELVDGMPGLVKTYYEDYYPALAPYYIAPFWQVSVYDFHAVNDKSKVIIGAEYTGEKPAGVALDMKSVPTATWAVFTIKGCIGETYDAAYARILTEWFPAGNYRRDETVPHLEVLPIGSEVSEWEIWMPVRPK
ncbi:MAG: AraC family transcriptional regulator [Defluviitaleaceae bacterium]|nr:AraC family transcriptional regulator [Defluviitaleaceae bacterium]